MKRNNKSKIRVLQFICPTGIYGAEMWLLALAKNLDKKSIDCHLAVTHESPDHNITILDRFMSLGFATHKLDVHGRFDPRIISKLVRIIKETRIDLVHTHGYKSDILGLLAARLTGIKAVTTPHGFENSTDWKLQSYIRLGNSVLKYFDRIVPLSEQLCQDVLSMKARPSRTMLIQNGVDLDEIKSLLSNHRSSGFQQENKTIGYVGQLASRKNVKDLIRTFDVLYRENDKIRLLLIGDGPQRLELENIARSLPSSLMIEFLGYRENCLSLMKGLNLFCMTSSLEGIPRALMEAMALEVPVAAYRIPGIEKLIVHNETGLLAEFGDVQGLKECWKRILFDHKLGSRLAKNGREHIEKNFSAKRMADEYTSMYMTMLAEE